MSDLEGLKPYATPRQAEYIDALIQHGSERKTADALGVHYSAVGQSIRAARRRAARQGYAPGHWTDGVAPGYLMGKVTVQRANGVVERTWERQSPEQQAWLEKVKEAVDGFMEGVSPIPLASAPLDFDNDIIPWIQIGDAHIGMLAHAAEAGENFNLEMAERELCGAIGILIDELPNCERVVINDLGDATHYENGKAETEASGHRLDQDRRFPNMIRVYSRIMRFIVDKALTKARHVDVIVNQGNHSRTNDWWMAELLRVAYGDTGRVHVLNNDSVFIAYRMGKTLVMTHHSDKCKPARLKDVLITDFREDFGQTEFHYIDIGHVHHGMVMKEHPSIFIESFNNLAPNDKFAAEGGWRSRKSITCILRSRTYGEKGRRVLPIQEVRDRIAGAVGAGRLPERMAYAV